MTSKEQDKSVAKASYLLMLVPVFMFGVFGGALGFLGDNSNPLSGFLWGIGVGLVIVVVSGVGVFIWEWIKKEAAKGKAWPYIVVGFAVAIAISTYFAVNLGHPSCDESGDPPYSSCTQYADDGFEATSNQQWDEFWRTLPVTAIISCLLALLVRSEVHKKK